MNFLIISEELVPPKPKELERKQSIFFSIPFQALQHFNILLFLLDLFQFLPLILQFLEHDHDIGKQEDKHLQKNNKN